MRLEGKHVWLVGASSGMGAALVPLLQAEGSYLTISARREEALRELAALHTGPGKEITVRPLDVTDGLQVAGVAREIWREHRPIDVVIYCSGTWQMADIPDFDAPAALQQIDVNYLGLVRVFGAVIRPMVERRQGELVGVASLSGHAGFPRAAAYSSAKAGAIAFLQSLRIDLKKYGVGVTTVNPGFFESRLTARNTFRMPFLMSTEAAAAATVRGLKDGRSEVEFPWQLALAVKLLTRLPRPAYEAVARRFMSGG